MKNEMKNALVKTIEAFIRRSELARDFQNRDWETILNGMNGAIRDQILDDIFEILKAALKKSFKDEQTFNKVWEKMTDPIFLEPGTEYVFSNDPKDCLCGYCLNAFKEYQNPKSSGRLFLGKIDKEFLIKEMQRMLQCIQEENPEKIADDILDTLCCSNYFGWIKRFA